ncbi:MAG TPA: ABC transporter permease, partial [Blastocatellia bacterium]|nr:ABC transporter permease [Blastocatellia bacterium]
MIQALLQDLRYGFRLLINNLSFTAVAVLALALGIGASTAVFSVIYGVLLRGLPYSEPDRLVQLSVTDRERNITGGGVSKARFLFMRDQNRSLEDMAAYTPESFNLTGVDEPEQIQGAKVSASMFRVLGVRPAIGRDFLPDEDDPGAGDVAVISHSLWLRRFGGDPMILGRPLILNGKSYAVVGVLAPGFQFLPGQLSAGSVDVFAAKPFDISSFTPQQVEGGVGYLYGVARLKGGASLRL